MRTTVAAILALLAGLAFVTASGAQTVKPLTKLDATGKLNFAAVCEGGERVVGVAGERDVYVWSLPSGARRSISTGFDARIEPTGIACNRKALAIASSHGAVAVFDFTGAERFRTDLKAEISNLAFSSDAAELAVTTANSPVQLWDVATGKRQWTGTTDFGNTYGTRIGPDGNLIVTADGDTHVRAYDRKGKLLYATEEGLLEPFDVSVSADGKAFMVAGAEGSIELRDSTTGKMLKKSANSGNPIFLVVMAPQGRKAIGLGLDAHTLFPAAIPYWNADGGELKNLPLDPKTLRGIGRGANSLLLVRQESPEELILESVD